MKDNMKCPKCGKKYISKSEYADWGNGKPAALYIHDYTKMGIVGTSCLVKEKDQSNDI